MEELTLEICMEYQKRARTLGGNASLVGPRRDLVLELQNRCNIPEIWAFNIVNGNMGKDYLAILEYKKSGSNKDMGKDNDYLEWLAEKEDKERLEQMLCREEMEN